MQMSRKAIKKRKSSPNEEDECDDESATMDVENSKEEEKEEEEKDEDGDHKMGSPGRESEEENEDNDDNNEDKGNDKPFLDSFYGLASSDGSERAQAANTLLYHCLLGPSANTRDAAYAFHRLLNGVCSGRAAARQGNASALTSFLKISISRGQMQEIRTAEAGEREEKEGGGPEKTDADTSLLAYVRERLIAATDPSQASQGRGRKKGSEERDYQFGRLFGILSVSRSGILLPSSSSSEGTNDDYDLDDIIKVTSDFLTDVSELYLCKKWMREPAANAVGNLVNSLYGICPREPDALKVVTHLVEKVIIPKFLDVPVTSKGSSVSGKYSAEQIAIATNIQAHAHLHPDASLPAPLDQPVFSAETIPLIAPTLAETSYVTQPRTHLVWDALWQFLTKETEEPSKNVVALRSSRGEQCPVGGDGDNNSVHDIIDGIVREVLIGRLVKAKTAADDGSGDGTKTTHERRALALCIFRNLVGVEFVSAITGRTKLSIEAEVLENTVLAPALIQRLFLDVIGAGSGKHKKSAEHMLKPLALQILGDVVESMATPNSSSSELLSAGDNLMDRRLLFTKTFLRCDLRFDSLTKTTTTLDLLGLNHNAAAAAVVGESLSKHHLDMWSEYISFLENKLISTRESSPSLSMGYIGLLFNAAKSILRVTPANDNDELKFDEYRTRTVQRILGFFMATSFFKCSGVSPPPSSLGEQITPSKHKKKKKKQKNIQEKQQQQQQQQHPAVEAAIRLQKYMANKEEDLPYQIRTILSARFFSLLADYIHTALFATRETPEPKQQPQEQQSKDSLMLEILIDICNGWKELEAAGAKRFSSENDPSEEDEKDDDKKNSSDNDDDDEKSDSKHILAKLQDTAKKFASKSIENKNDISKEKILSQQRCANGCAVMASTLYIQLLACGEPEDAVGGGEGYQTTDREEDVEEITCALVELEDISRRFLSEEGEDKKEKSPEEEEEEDENPLVSLAELCVGLLSSGLSSDSNSDHGASLKLLREAIKSCWMGCLALSANLAPSSESVGHAHLDSNVINVLLEAIGASDSENADADGSDMEEEEEDDSDNSESNEKGSKMIDDGSDDDGFGDKTDKADKDVDMKEKEEGEDEEESDDEIEIDPDNLQSLLEEENDSDADIEGQLEHHEGADEALAKLIQLKQEARKAGQQALEKIEIVKQLRCTFLLELLLAKSDSWVSLFRSDVVLKMVLPIMNYRWQVEKTLANIDGNTDKNVLVDRLTSMLNTKIFKMRLASFQCSESVNLTDCATTVASRLLGMAQTKGISKAHVSCCSNGLVMAVRSISDVENKLKLAETVYAESVNEWSSKRTSRIDVKLFDDLIHHCPSISQAVLASPLAKAAAEARSTFVKSEAFRLLSLLYNPKLNPQASDLDKVTWTKLQDATPLVMNSILTALKDNEMQKAKRLRDVLRCAENLITMLSALSSPAQMDAGVVSASLKEIGNALEEVSERTDSQGVKNTCEKLVAEIKQQQDATAADEEKKQETKDEEKPSVESSSRTSAPKPSKSKPSKSKKKKKKKKYK